MDDLYDWFDSIVGMSNEPKVITTLHTKPTYRDRNEYMVAWNAKRAEQKRQERARKKL